MRINPPLLRTWIEIDRKAIERNTRFFRRNIGSAIRIAGVIKSNAYGHNIHLVGKILEGCPIDMLAVDSLVEALPLRKTIRKMPILVLGYTIPDLYPVAAKSRIAITISTFESLKALRSFPGKQKLSIHIKVDTGMHRQGFLFKDMSKVLQYLRRLPSRVVLAGLYTHFAEAKDASDRAYTEKQIAEFLEWKAAFEKAGYHPLCHASATGGALLYPEAHFDLVRVGMGLYGIWPSPEIEQVMERRQKHITPVLSWKAIVSEIKTIPSGSFVGYDRTLEVKKETMIAIIPIGYWHGYPRALSDKGIVLVKGKRAKVLGRVSMDMIVVDVTDIPRVRPGDIVTLIGKNGKEEITAKELALLGAMSPYELLTRINPKISRTMI